MAAFFPDGMREVNLNTANSNSGNFTTTGTEDFDTEAMRGSIQQLLSKNLGEYVVVEFLIGTQSMSTKEGILHSVGRSFLTLYEEKGQTFVSCDIFSVKFITFFLPGQRPGTSGGTSYVPSIPGRSAPVTPPAPPAGGCGYRSLGN